MQLEVPVAAGRILGVSAESQRKDRVIAGIEDDQLAGVGIGIDMKRRARGRLQGRQHGGVDIQRKTATGGSAVRAEIGRKVAGGYSAAVVVAGGLIEVAGGQMIFVGDGINVVVCLAGTVLVEGRRIDAPIPHLGAVILE